VVSAECAAPAGQPEGGGNKGRRGRLGSGRLRVGNGHDQAGVDGVTSGGCDGDELVGADGLLRIVGGSAVVLSTTEVEGR
jgi:hypothetical protein